MANRTRREQVFFSYSRKDKKWLELFKATLRPFIGVSQFSVWDDTKIKAGDIWRDEIKQALASAKVAVLLVSINFLNSDFIAENELSPLLEAAQNEGVRILLVVVGHSLYEETELGRFQAVNDPSRPLAGLSAANRDKEVVRICKEIKSAVLGTATGQENSATQKVGEEEATPVIQFYSCYISYSTRDEEFARRLYSRMRDENLRVWFAPEDMKGGQKLYEQIERAIQIHDRLLLILSESSMQSEWVRTEIQRARETEIKEGRRKLFPISIVEFEKVKAWRSFDANIGKDLAKEVREYLIPDFSNWKDHDAFEKAFERLLRDLRAEEAGA